MLLKAGHMLRIERHDLPFTYPNNPGARVACIGPFEYDTHYFVQNNKIVVRVQARNRDHIDNPAAKDYTVSFLQYERNRNEHSACP